jgi:hypothetical protein
LKRYFLTVFVCVVFCCVWVSHFVGFAARRKRRMMKAVARSVARWEEEGRWISVGFWTWKPRLEMRKKRKKEILRRVLRKC